MDFQPRLLLNTTFGSVMNGYFVNDVDRTKVLASHFVGIAM